MNDNKMSEIIRTSLENAKEVFDANTVIGDPITSPDGTMIIPVSKISMGIATGGIDYKGKRSTGENGKNNFGGAGGTGVTVSPVGFLVIKPNGSVELLNVSSPTGYAVNDSIEQVTSFIEKSPDILKRIKNVFSSKSKKDDTDEEPEVVDNPDAE